MQDTQQHPEHYSFSDEDFRYTYIDDLADDQRWSTWASVEKGAHGPEPRPDWVITERGAIDTELGILKTGKEADVFLIERAVVGDPSRATVMAAKRYRTTDHRQFHRDAGYTEGRSAKRSRDNRAIRNKSTFGKLIAQGAWAQQEYDALSALWKAGLPVPYPVMIDGTEILMEYIEYDGDAAPRLAQTRPDRATLESYFDQLREALRLLARHGWAHGDLSPYNILAQGERLVVIDLPQVLDIVGNPNGVEYLLRDCTNICKWFNSRGLDVDPDELLADLLAYAW